MKKIICYGDSNTFGFNPANFARYDENIIWPAILNKNLGGDFEVINEGMCDRTGFVNNKKGFEFSAQRHFFKVFPKMENVDLLILWLGTNDLQFQYDISFGAIEAGLEKLIAFAKKYVKNIVVISPVILTDSVLDGYFKCQFDKTSVIKSRKIGRIVRQISNANHCAYFDVNKYVAPSTLDGLHYDEASHKIIADKLTDFVKTQYGF